MLKEEKEKKAKDIIINEVTYNIIIYIIHYIEYKFV